MSDKRQDQRQARFSQAVLELQQLLATKEALEVQLKLLESQVTKKQLQVMTIGAVIDEWFFQLTIPVGIPKITEGRVKWS